MKDLVSDKAQLRKEISDDRYVDSYVGVVVPQTETSKWKICLFRKLYFVRRKKKFWGVGKWEGVTEQHSQSTGLEKHAFKMVALSLGTYIGKEHLYEADNTVSNSATLCFII